MANRSISSKVSFLIAVEYLHAPLSDSSALLLENPCPWLQRHITTLLQVGFGFTAAFLGSFEEVCCIFIELFKIDVPRLERRSVCIVLG